MKTHTPHTPGPWSINAYEQWDKNGPIKRASIVAQWDNRFTDTILIATVNTTKQLEANAARIVACVNACENLADPGAVPDLLAALRELMTGHSMAGQAMAQKAIARATGEKGGK